MIERTLEEIAKEAQERKKIKEAGIAIALGSLMLLLLVFAGHRLAAQKESSPVLQEAVKEFNAYEHVRIEAKAGIVFDLATGEILYEKNAEAQLPLASLTKLLTLYAAQKVLAPMSPIVLSEEALEQEGDNGFAVGESFAFKDVAAFALIPSSNDAAKAIEEAAATRTAQGKVALLASAAASAGLSETYAMNGTGLDETETLSGGYGSAHDVALLAGALLKEAPELARLSTLPVLTVSSLSGTSYTIENTNDAVGRFPGLLLSKTGFTDLAGGNLVIVFDAGLSHPVAIVVLGSSREGRVSDVDILLTATLSRFAYTPL